jgi:hypothetical protein
MRTRIGSRVLPAFYRVYGLFAPTATDAVRSSPYVEDVAEVAVRPLIWMLALVPSVYSSFSYAPELGVFIAGIVAGGLLTAFYLGAPGLAAICIFECTRRLRLEPKHFQEN